MLFILLVNTPLKHSLLPFNFILFDLMPIKKFLHIINIQILSE